MKNLKHYTFVFVFALLLPLASNAQKAKAPNIEMVFVKGGTFMMGCPDAQTDCEDDERPAHQVTLSDYSIGKYEITQAQWRAVMGKNPSAFSGCDDCPVEQVSWLDATDFCKKLSKLTGKKYSLPTEAQWEYAARGGSKSKGYIYAGSNSVEEVAWYGANSDKRTQKVGTKQANELGIHDMSGNVWEWCLDRYDENYYKSSPAKDPKGSKDGMFMLLRGGGWYRNALLCRVADRSYANPTSNPDDIGFRVVLLP